MKNDCQCPECKGTKFDYDSFEDMYRCEGCDLFWYPKEIGLSDNRDAPIFHLSDEKK